MISGTIFDGTVVDIFLFFDGGSGEAIVKGVDDDADGVIVEGVDDIADGVIVEGVVDNADVIVEGVNEIKSADAISRHKQ